MSNTSAVVNKPGVNTQPWMVWLAVLAFVYLLLIGVGVIGDGFKWISGGTQGAEKIFAFASNPIAGVILGILATSLVQSSSTVTSVIVGLVAGGVPVSYAVPMVMGANMGTTITNTIVSLGNLKNAKTFNKSFQAATVHDFFNLYSIVIFLPLEILFHPLEKLAGALTGLFVSAGNASMSSVNVVGAITKPVSKTVVNALKGLPDTLGALLAIAIGIACIIISVIYLGQLLRSVMTGRAQEVVNKSIGRGPLSGIGSGTLVTVLVQSSSTTTSLVVPLAGTGVLSTRQVFPFTMGANIGTCITALLAATAVTGKFQAFALQIALVHLLYNLLGVIIFLVTPWLKDLPIRSAEWLGNKAESNRMWALGYIFAVFFALPSAVLAAQVSLKNTDSAVVSVEQKKQKLNEAELEVLQDNMRVE